MADVELANKKVLLGSVPRGYVVELLGFRDGKEVGIGQTAVVLGRFVQLLPELDLKRNVRLKLHFADKRELRFCGGLQVYCWGSESRFTAMNMVLIASGTKP